MSLSSSQIRDLVGPKQKPVILEVGAHTGEDTCEFLKCYPDAVVHCFEPDPRCCRLWRAHSFGKNAHLYELALSDKDDLVCLNLSEAEYPKSVSLIRGLLRKVMGRPSEIVVASLGQSSIVSPTSGTTQYPWLVFRKRLEVSSLRLDTWRNKYAPELKSVDFLWTDVQGAERRLIQGGCETLAMARYVTLEYGECDVYGEAMDRNETIHRMENNSFRVLEEFSGVGPIGSLLFENQRSAASLANI